MMQKWWRRLRGLIGLTSVGGFTGALFGGIGTVVTTLIGGGSMSLQMVLLGAGLWGGISAVATAGVGVFLASGRRQKRLHELSATKAGLFGMLLGAAAPLLVVSGIKLLYVGVWPTLTLSIAAGMAIGGALCGTLGAGLVLAGKRANHELPGHADDALLGAGE